MNGGGGQNAVCWPQFPSWFVCIYIYIYLYISSSSSQPFMPLLADGLLNSCHALWFWAALIHWLLPTSSMLSLHLLLGLPLTRFPSLGVHSNVILAHLVLLILATCPARYPLMHRTLPIISFTPVLHLIISFRILSLFVMFNNNLHASLSHCKLLLLMFSWSPCLCSIGHSW